VSAYRTGAGKVIRVTSVLGKGGEGTVYHIDGHDDLAAKIYTDGKQLERHGKIAAMVASGLHQRSNLIAFPIDELFGGAGKFVGFTMRKITGVKPIHELYAPGSRKIEFPKADFRVLARTATNVARAIASVHQTRCVVGDINHSGMLVSERATVTLIDADSFQIRSGPTVHRCRVGVGEYTPPELQGASFEKVDRDVTHDGFGLAVLIFQLLFMGRHPFAGRGRGNGDMPIEKAIKEGRFAYTLLRKAETKMDPPPFVPVLTDFTLELAQKFERAFASNPALFKSRPAAAEWVSALERFESELIQCRINSAHHHPRNAGSCPWCRLENGMGVSLFAATGGANYIPPRSTFDLNAAMAVNDKLLGPGPTPLPTSIMPPEKPPQRSPLATSKRRGAAARRTAGLLLAASCLLLTMTGLPIALLGLFGAWFLVFGNNGGLEELRTAKLRAESEWNAAVKDWETEASAVRFDQKKAELTKLAAEHRALPALERSRLDDLERRRREIQLQRFLESHLIDRAKIGGIGDGRKATLASYGIEDAFDITRQKVLGVPGFGEAMATKLLSWRASVERRFVFNASLGTDPAAIRQVRDAIGRRRAELEQALTRGPLELEQLKSHTISARRRPTQRLIEAYRAVKQAEVDLA